MQEFRIYRPNSTGTGSAFALQLSYKKEEKFNKYQAFLIGAKQMPSDNDNAKFAWDKALIVKMDLVDIGEFLAVLQRRKDHLGFKGNLYHESKAGNKIIKLDKTENGYSLSISAQDTEKKSLGQVYAGISHGEAATMCTLCERMIIRLLEW
jgi:hypothetical protein